MLEIPENRSVEPSFDNVHDDNAYGFQFTVSMPLLSLPSVMDISGAKLFLENLRHDAKGLVSSIAELHWKQREPPGRDVLSKLFDLEDVLSQNFSRKGTYYFEDFLVSGVESCGRF